MGQCKPHLLIYLEAGTQGSIPGCPLYSPRVCIHVHHHAVWLGGPPLIRVFEGRPASPFARHGCEVAVRRLGDAFVLRLGVAEDSLQTIPLLPASYNIGKVHNILQKCQTVLWSQHNSCADVCLYPMSLLYCL